MYVIRVMPEELPAGNQATESPPVRVAMSNGKVGYVAAAPAISPARTGSAYRGTPADRPERAGHNGYAEFICVDVS